MLAITDYIDFCHYSETGAGRSPKRAAAGRSKGGGGVRPWSDRLGKITSQSAGFSPSPSLPIQPFVTISEIWVLRLIKSFQKNPSF